MSVRPKLLAAFLLLLILSAPAGSVAAYEPSPDPVPARARVLTVLEDEEAEEGPWGFALRRQTVTLRILTGPYRGQSFTVDNYIPGQPAYDIILSAGDTVLVAIEEAEGEPVAIFIEDFVRDQYLYVLAALFALSLVAAGGRKGLRALLVLVLTILGVFFVLLPRLLAGSAPVPTTICVCALVTLVTMLMVAGPGRKALAATLGATGGVAVAGMLALYSGGLARLMGLNAQEAQLLYYVEDLTLDFRGLLFSGMILGALGAIMDVSMSIASATEEVRRAAPRLSPLALFQAGMNVGRDVMGTMANTLILAYTGGALPLLLLLMAYNASLIKVINLDLIATEVVRALTGSIGVVLSVPITAALASAVFARPAGRRTVIRARAISRPPVQRDLPPGSPPQ
ncbi:MAG: YibE/F family protein [bacterium]|nr:YibE/F family protein [bacterium]